MAEYMDQYIINIRLKDFGRYKHNSKHFYEIVYTQIL